MTVADADVVLVGGGLANTLIALRLRERQPAPRLLLIEQDATLGGQHTWSFHGTDVTADQRQWLAPLIVMRWSGQEVRFPGYERSLTTPYFTITSARLHDYAAERLGQAVALSTPVQSLGPDHVVLADGRRIAARLVIDGRGPQADDALAVGYQKFLGLEVETARPHGLTQPILMDATVAQVDGFRFVYTLPLSPTRLLIEDTCYSDAPDLAETVLEQRILTYVDGLGVSIARVRGRETGVLPIALAGDLDRHWRRDRAAVPRSGLRAWLFHATTGYSLPAAVALADAIGDAGTLTSAAIGRLIETRARRHWHAQRLFRLLNRFLFLAAPPEQRVDILERFYRLPQPTIERFYAGRLTAADIAHLMTVMATRPPVAIGRALAALSEDAAWRFVEQRAGKGGKLR